MECLRTLLGYTIERYGNKYKSTLCSILWLPGTFLPPRGYTAPCYGSALPCPSQYSLAQLWLQLAAGSKCNARHLCLIIWWVLEQHLEGISQAEEKKCSTATGQAPNCACHGLLPPHVLPSGGSVSSVGSSEITLCLLWGILAWPWPHMHSLLTRCKSFSRQSLTILILRMTWRGQENKILS